MAIAISLHLAPSSLTKSSLIALSSRDPGIPQRSPRSLIVERGAGQLPLSGLERVSWL